ncbi:MAG: hypothetical protein P8130_02190, partial [Deltaproteobacteria bacterium]
MTTQNQDDPIGGIPITPAPKSQQEGAPVPEAMAPALRHGREDKAGKAPPPVRYKRFILAIAGIVLALGLGTYLLIPKLLTSSFPQYLSKRLHRSVTIGDADFSLFPPALTLRHCIIGPRTD